MSRHKKVSRFAILAVAVVLAAVVVACAKAAPETPASVSELLDQAANVTLVRYDVVAGTVDSTGTKREADAGKVWVKGSKMRVTLTRREQPAVEEYLIDWDAHTMYTWDPIEKAIREQRNAWEIPEMLSAMYWAKAMTFYDTKKIAGTETIDGKACWVVDCAKESDSFQVTRRVWIRKDHPFVARIELRPVDNKTTMTYEFRRAEFGDIPDSVFELP